MSNQRRATFIRLANPEDKNTRDEGGRANNPDDSETLQQELNAMMTQSSNSSSSSSSSSSMFDVMPTAGQNEDATDLDLYNAAPLFTGAVVTVFSIAFTGYLIYAGITGDDFMTGHPLN